MFSKILQKQLILLKESKATTEEIENTHEKFPSKTIDSAKTSQPSDETSRGIQSIF